LKIKVLSIRDDYLEIEASEEDPSFFDSLSELMQKIDGVDYAGMFIEHPLTKKIILRVKTDPSKIKAQDALKQAIGELKQISSQLREEFEKL